MSLVRVLTLRKDNTVGIEPVAALQTLRQNHESVGERILPAGREIVLPNIAGNALEIQAEIDPRDANEVRLTVLRSPGKEEYTDIRFRRKGYVGADAGGRSVTRDAVVIDPTHASLHRDVQHRPPEGAPFELPKGELLRLRIFVDRSIVEVFANGRQCVALRVYPQRPDSVGVSIFAQSGDASLRRLDAWQMKSIYTMASD
jgi:beta-fructofuranosidase